MHLLKNPRQSLHLLDSEMRLDNAPRRKLHRLNRLLPRPHRRPDNRQTLPHDIRWQRTRHGNRLALGYTHADYPPAEAQQVERLCVRAVMRCADDDCVGAQAVGKCLDGLGDVGRAVDGDEVLCTRFENQVLFAGVVDADYAVAYAAG